MAILLEAAPDQRRKWSGRAARSWASRADRGSPGPEPLGDRRRTDPARARGRGASHATGEKAFRADLGRDHARRCSDVLQTSHQGLRRGGAHRPRAARARHQRGVAGFARPGRADRDAGAAGLAAVRSSEARSPRWFPPRRACSSPGSARRSWASSNESIEVDALALNMVTMIGLALGVDYSLLIVSRFREELARGADVPSAVKRRSARAGRTLIFAGTALVGRDARALLIAPGRAARVGNDGRHRRGWSWPCSSRSSQCRRAGVAGHERQPLAVLVRWRARTRGCRLSQRALRKPGVAAFFVLLPAACALGPGAGAGHGAAERRQPPARRRAHARATRHSNESAGRAGPRRSRSRSAPRGRSRRRSGCGILKRFQERVGAGGGRRGRTRARRAAGTHGRASQPHAADRLRRRAGLRGSSAAFAQCFAGTGRLHDGLVRLSGAGQLCRASAQAADGSDQIADGVSGAAPQTKRLADGIEADSGGQRSRLTRASAGRGAGLSGCSTTSRSSTRTFKTRAKRGIDAKLRPARPRPVRGPGGAPRDRHVLPTTAADPEVQRAKQDVQTRCRSSGHCGPTSPTT